MTKISRWARLGWIDAAVVILGIAILIALQVAKTTDAPPEPVDIAQFSLEAKVTELATLTPEGAAAEAYQAWLSSTDYYGAFAAAADGRFGWSTRYGSPAAADAGALAFCKGRGAACTIIARVLPEDYAPGPAVTLEADAARGLQEWYGKTGAKAFAHSEQGVAHWAWGHATIADAERVALHKCEARVQAYIKGKPIPYWPCRILLSAP